MILPREEAVLFMKLHSALMDYVNRELGVIESDGSRASYADLPPDKRSLLVKGFLGRRDLIDAFVAANPAALSVDELAIVSAWRYLVSGRFIALRQLRKHTILLNDDPAPTAYGVLGLNEPMDQVIPSRLPAMIETVLLPFRGKIVYDGIVGMFNVAFGPGIRRGLEQSFKDAKAANRFLTELSGSPVPQTRVASSPRPKPARKPRRDQPEGRQLLAQVVAMTDAFCQSHLNDECMVLCRALAEKLAAKRPSPLYQGKLESWACGIVRVIGWVNFLGDRTQSPHLKTPVIDRAFGVSESTGQGKAKAIRRMLKIDQFDHRWIRPSQLENHPLIWMLEDSRGFLVDVRRAPQEAQRAAFKQGLIPYVPADRQAAAVQDRIARSPSRRLFQFKITLRGIEPAIWRRIQVWDDTLDKLHEHLQTAMGWTNSHLHEFIIQGRRCGDPELIDDGFEPFTGLDSRQTLMSAVLPADGESLAFEYRYDFGDDWVHDVVFEGSPTPRPGTEYPQCLEGARACPPEDVGGVSGFAEYVEAMADPNHNRHRELLRWRGPYNPAAFSPRLVTHAMQEGMPEWRERP